MFTGIIEAVGTVAAVEPLGADHQRGGRRLTLRAPFAGALRPDESVAIQGACQTVVRQDAETFDVVTIEETLRKTNFGRLKEGDAVNLERALQAGGRLDGHFVQGHVDATGTVARVEEEATNRLYTIRFEEKFAPYVIPVGSVALDGISLTVARLEENELTVAIIPHTYENTAISGWEEGTAVNIEFDLVGKYVVRWLSGQERSADADRIAEAWRGR